jgi:hypothetical protein
MRARGAMRNRLLPAKPDRFEVLGSRFKGFKSLIFATLFSLCKLVDSLHNNSPTFLTPDKFYGFPLAQTKINVIVYGNNE